MNRPRRSNAEADKINPSTYFPNKPVLTRRLCRIGSVIDNPVRGACRNAVHLLGGRLFELGGHDLMNTVWNRVLEKNPRHACTLDSAWER
jgi:hypothetical protein